jgi:hypothetical protein
MSIFERVSKRARRRYWEVRHGQPSDDTFPSEQVESLMAAVCEVLEEELSAMRADIALGAPHLRAFRG